MGLSDKELQELHLTLLEILDYVCAVCDENNLSYLLIAGTALGAYRHNGFIPWDDDLDIALPREDYEKLKDILHKKKNSIYSIQDESNEDKYFLPFIKIRKNGTIFREAITSNIYMNNGIYIDVFPIDTISNINSPLFRFRAYVIDAISHALRFRTCSTFYYKTRSKVRYFYDWLICLPFASISNNRLLKIQTKLMVQSSGINDKYAINYASTYSWKKDLVPFNVYFPVKKIEFEGREYYSFAKLKDYLSQIYGDYMELPPENKRHTHEPIELKF